VNAAADGRRMRYFAMLTFDEQLDAIQRLAASGMSVYGIASAAGVSVEQVRTIVAAARSQCEDCE
jgi:hypothetical protein